MLLQFNNMSHIPWGHSSRGSWLSIGIWTGKGPPSPSLPGETEAQVQAPVSQETLEIIRPLQQDLIAG